MTVPVRVALMGLGQRGLQHLKSLWALQEEGVVQITVLADAFAANLDQGKIRNYVDGFRPEGILYTTSFDELLGREQDALYSASPRMSTPERSSGRPRPGCISLSRSR